MISNRCPLPCPATDREYRIEKYVSKYFAADVKNGRPLHGVRIGHFEVLHLIGEGGSCFAYHALDLETGNIVCLKEIYPVSLADRLERNGKSLVPRGATDARDLDARILEYVAQETAVSDVVRYTHGMGGITNDGRFLTATQVKPEFPTLARYLCVETQGGSPLSEAHWDAELSGQERILDKLNLAKRITETLQKFHNKGFLHLDLKPENLFISDLIQNQENHLGNRHVFLLDYGSSVPVDAGGHIMADVPLNVTAAYAAPEVLEYLEALAAEDVEEARNIRDLISYAADTYAVVKILFSFLNNGVDEPAMGYRYDSVRQNQDLAGLPEPVQKQVVDLIAKGMSAFPDQRYRTAEDLLSALEQVVDRVQARYSLVPRQPPHIARDRFIGREKELQELDRLIQANNLVFISGAGGIGKSELAAQYAVRQKDKLVVHMAYAPGSNGTGGDELDHSGLRQLLLNAEITNYPLPPTSEKSEERVMWSPEDVRESSFLEERRTFYRQKCGKLREICDDSVLLIVDNFNVDNDEGLADLENLGCKVILTTWCNYASDGFAQLTLENTDETWAVELFCSQCPSAAQDPELVREIVRTVEYHTTAVLLLGAQMQSDHIDAKALLHALRDGLQKVGKTKVSFRKDGILRRDRRTFGYLYGIFDMSSMSKEARILLLKLSFVAPYSVSIQRFQEWNSEELDLDLINDLIRLRWIEEDPRTREIRLTQVIADVVFDCAQKFEREVKNFLDCFSIWCRQTITLSSTNCGCGKSLIDSVAKRTARITPTETTIMATTKIANICHGLLMDDHAARIGWLNIKCLRVLVNKSRMTYLPLLGESCYNLAVELRNDNKYQMAETALREALNIQRELRNQACTCSERKLAEILYGLARLLSENGKLQEAVGCFLESLEIYRTLPDRRLYLNGYMLYLTIDQELGILYARLGQHRESIDAFFKYFDAVGKDLMLNPRLPPHHMVTTLASACHHIIVCLEAYGLQLETESIHQLFWDVHDKITSIECGNMRDDELRVMYNEVLAVYRHIGTFQAEIQMERFHQMIQTLRFRLLESTPTISKGKISSQDRLIQHRLAVSNAVVYMDYLVISCLDVANLFFHLGMYRDAERLYREAKRIIIDRTGNRPVGYYIEWLEKTNKRLADVLKVMGRYQEIGALNN